MGIEDNSEITRQYVSIRNTAIEWERSLKEEIEANKVDITNQLAKIFWTDMTEVNKLDTMNS
jgi:hypothetical protein